MKATPIYLALAFVLTFALGLLIGLNQSGVALFEPAASDRLASVTIDGHTVEYDPTADVTIDVAGEARSNTGAHTIARDTDARSGGLTTDSAELAANYQQTAPTDGLGASGGGILSTIQAKAGKPMNALYVIAALCLIGGAVVTFWLKMPALGLGLAAGGLGVAAIAYFVTDAPWVFWLLIPLAGAAGVWWLYNNGRLKATKVALSNVVAGVGSLKETAPSVFETVTGAIKGVAGKENAVVKREVERAKA